MQFTPVSNTARVELVFTHNNILCENVFHVQSANSSWTTSELTDLSSLFKTWWDTNLKPLVGVYTVLTMIRSTSLHSQVSPKVEYLTGLPITGTGTGVSMPGNVTVAVKWVTGNRGRSARGRTYHIGLCETQVTLNEIDESVYTDLLDAYQALLTAVNVGVWSLRVVSLWSNKVKRTEGLTYAITGCGIEKTVDTQRRRLV